MGSKLYVVNYDGLLSGRIGGKGSIVSGWEIREACAWHNKRTTGELYEAFIFEEGVDLAVINSEGNKNPREILEKIASPFDIFENSELKVLEEYQSYPISVKAKVKGVGFSAQVIKARDYGYTFEIYKRKSLLSNITTYGATDWAETIEEASLKMMQNLEVFLSIQFNGSIY